MIKRWQGNSGRVQHLPEAGDRPAQRRVPNSAQHKTPEPAQRNSPEPARHAPAREAQQRAVTSRPPGPAQANRPGGLLPGLDGIGRLLPGKFEELETEDLILLLILYLMYRESGDSELLMIMGAMFLL